MGKRMLAILLTAVAWTPIAASAQDRGDWGHRGDRQGRAQWSGERHLRSDRPRASPAVSQPTARPLAVENHDRRSNDRTRSRQWGGGATGDRRDWQRGDHDRIGRDLNGRGRDAVNRDWRGSGDGDWRQRDAYRDQRAWNREWRQDRRYDWNRHRLANRYTYRLPRYYAPAGWSYGYRRFSIGTRLSPLLFRQSYWIGDLYAYRLPPAHGAYRWVRYYDDALLVDTFSGQVVDVIHGIFW